MDFIRQHKLTAFFIVLYIAAIVAGYFFYKELNEKAGAPTYGDRLAGIENVPITDEQKKSLVDKLKSYGNVISVSDPHLSGKTYNIVITVADVDTADNAKKLSEEVTKSLDDKQNAFYDVQVFITKKYNCTLEATGVADEDGVFTGDVKVKFERDVASDKQVLGYGITNSKKKDYNAKSEYTINTDGEFVIYGYTKDKVGESTCSIKIVRKSAKNSGIDSTINSTITKNFPIIGYKRKGSKSFVWTKDR